MSLQTDRIFLKALSESTDIAAKVDDRIYSTAIPMPEEDADNVPVPYIIVTFDGLQNDAHTKDSSFEGMEDKVQIGVTVVAETRPKLAELTELVRTAIRTFFEDVQESDEDYSLVPIDYMFSAQAVQYDDLKPCYYQIMSYQCDTEV